MSRLRQCLLGAGAFGSGTFLAMTLAQKQRPPATWTDLASTYDVRIDRDERTLGIDERRHDLADLVTGATLEVAGGTGRNIDALRDKLERGDVTLTLTDANESMLDVARERGQGLVHVVVGEAEALPFDDNAFDTVIQTFGLCSVDDPVQALKEAARVVKPTGKVLLLEHGRSPKWATVNWFLDVRHDAHKKTWGCSFNRDVAGMVLRSPDWHVDDHKMFHMGTTHLFVLSPVKRP